MKLKNFFKITSRRQSKILFFLSMILLTIFAFIMQVSILPSLPFITTVPNLLIILVFSYALIYGERVGVYAGVLCGFLYDAYFDESFGIYILIYSCIGYFNGVLNAKITDDSITFPMLLSIINGFIFNFYIYFIHFFLRGRFEFVYCFVNIMFPNVLFTMIATIVLYKILFNLVKTK